MSGDRHTTTGRDEIEDHCLTPEEMDAINYTEVRKFMALMFTDEASGSPQQFKWMHWIQGKIFK